MNKECCSIVISPGLIEARKFDHVNPVITTARFPIPERLHSDYKLFPVRKDIYSQGAIEKMDAKGYMPANAHELLLWHEWNGKDAVVALGSVMGVNGDRRVLIFAEISSKRCLELELWSRKWKTGYYHFLGVRKL